MSARTVSYRVSLAIAIPVLILLTGAIIALTSYRTTKQSIDSLRSRLFEQAGSQAANETRAHVMQAVPAADLVSALLRDATLPADITQDDSLMQTLLGVLRANPGFAWVSFSDASGSFVGAQRKGDDVRTNRSRIVDGKTELFEHAALANGSLELLQHGMDTHYDPRTRPFYKAATEAKRRVWTPPYLFYTVGAQGAPGVGYSLGVTCAEPVYARDGKLRGVVTVDFDLDVLSRFLSALHLSPNSLVFLYADDGTILAHPSMHVNADSGHGASDLITYKNISDPLVHAFFQKEPSAEFDVSYEGQPYVAATRAFSIDDQIIWHVGAVAPESDFVGPLRDNAKVALLISFAAVAIAVAIGLSLSRALARPLANISREMERAGRFEIGEHVPSKTWFTEISAMDRALGAMMSGLRSFGAYVPKDLVRAVLASGTRAELGGTTRQLTIFFSDLAGFTTLSETMKPDALVELLGGYFDAMTNVIQSRGGTVDKFIGDAIMAFWNAPGEEPDHAVLACKAALACQAKLDEMRKKDPRLAGLRARIGLATGEVLVGNIGSSDRMNYTVMGDTVNLASRLEGLNKAYGTPIMMSEATYAAVKGTILARPIDVVAVKGKVTGVRVFEPLAPTSGASDEDERACAAAERAIASYLARDFAAAAKAWDDVLAVRPDDAASKLMKERALGHAASPPPADWDGAHVMHEK